MVLLWTQHDGERIEPQPTDDIAQRELHKDDPNKDNLKGSGAPASTSTGKTGTPGLSSPVPEVKVATLIGGTEGCVLPPSEKHVVTLRQVSEIFDRNKSSVYVSPSVSPSTTTSSSITSEPPSPPSSLSLSPASPPPSTIKENVVVEVEKLGVVEESAPATRVDVNKRTSTLGPGVSFKLKDDQEEEEAVGEEEEEGKLKKRKSNKRKFYTLPRNWKSKAADFILTKGKVKFHIVSGDGDIVPT